MSKVIKSRNVEFKPEAVRLPLIVPVVYRESGAAGAPQFDLEKRARSLEKMVRDAEQRAASVIGNAEASAQAIMEKARADGYEAGRQEGYAGGLAAAEAEAAGIRGEAARSLQEARDEARRIVAASGQQIVDIAMAVARKVIKREVSADPEVVLANAREALMRVDREDAVSIKTSPMEVAVVDNVREWLRKESGGLGDITVQEDPSVGPGGCVVCTAKGTVDARIESQVAVIAERLSEVVGQRDCDGTAPQGNR